MSIAISGLPPPLPGAPPPPEASSAPPATQRERAAISQPTPQYKSAQPAPAAVQSGLQKLPGTRRWFSLRWRPKPPPETPAQHVEVQYLRAFESPDMAAKQAYLAAFNQHIAPRLITEEAALERLAMKHAYFKLCVGQELCFNIRRTLTSQPVHDYARNYVVADTLVDKDNGLVAYLLTPKQHANNDAPWLRGLRHRHIILFRGTNPQAVMDPLCKAENYPEGLAADADPLGVGFSAFAHNRPTLVAWVRAALQQGRDVTITGHSLGGAYAARTVAALSPPEQLRCHGVTFNAPGLDAETADQISPEAGLRLVRMRRDPISKVGQKHPPGVIIKQQRERRLPLFSALPNHTTASLSTREINGKKRQYFLREPHWTDTSLFAEALRLGVAKAVDLPP